jgi:DNA-binding CsgD family transcriptional regulator
VNGPLSELGRVLAGAPGSETLTMLGRLLDSMPIPVLLTDCSEELRCVYGNAASRLWVPADKLPVEGRPLAEVFETMQQNLLLPALQRTCATGEPAHLRNIEYMGLVGAAVTLPGEVTVWDWEVYPVRDAAGMRSHVLTVGVDITDHVVREPDLDPDARRRNADLHERAAGILRIFGVAPGAEAAGPAEGLTTREREIANLVAQGLTNASIASRLLVSRSTVSSHVATVLRKLGFTSRVQLAAWVVAQRLSERPEEKPG